MAASWPARARIHTAWARRPSRIILRTHVRELSESGGHGRTAWVQPFPGAAGRAGRASLDRPGLCFFDLQPAAVQTDWPEQISARRLDSGAAGLDLFDRNSGPGHVGSAVR